MTAGDHGWRPFEVSRDDCDRAIRSRILAMFDDMTDRQEQRDARRRFVSLLMHVAVMRAVAVFRAGVAGVAIRDARVELDADGVLVLDYVIDMPIHQAAFTHAVIV